MLVRAGASFARGFEPFLIKTRDGEVHSGVIARETGDAVYLHTNTGVESPIPRSAIQEIQQNTVSIMPEGLDVQLSREELSDLVAFLQSLR